MPDETEKDADRRQVEQRQDDRMRDAALSATALSDHDLLIKLSANLENLAVQLDNFILRIETTRISFVTQQEFAPVKSVVFGLVALIVTGVIGALLTLVIRK